MNVERYGAGSEVYLGLHGWSGDHRAFAPIVNGLPASASMYSADLPGYGRSPAPAEWDLSLIVDEIIATIREIASDRITVIGICSGANLALLAAMRPGSRIGRLVLIDTFASMPGYFRLFTNGSYGRHAYYSAFANPLGRWLANQSLRGHRTAETNLTSSFVSIDHEVTYNYLLMLAKIEGLEQFRDLAMPIDIAYGERTFRAVKRSVSQWLALWPQARAWELKGAGHMPVEEATQQLGRIIFEQKENS